MRATPQPLTILIVNERGERRAIDVPRRDVKGWFAIHRSCTGGGFLSEWTVTHVPSGFAIQREIKRRAQALAIVALCEAAPCDWSAEAPEAVTGSNPAVVRALLDGFFRVMTEGA